MQVGISQAEDRIAIQLQNMGLTTGMSRTEVLAITDNRVTVFERERFTRADALEADVYTLPDYNWKTLKYPVYLDGIPVHSSRGARIRDERITRCLEAAGWFPERFSYCAPLSQKLEREICLEIQRFLEANTE